MSIAKTQAHPRAVKEPTRAARAALVTFENFDSLPDAAMVDARVVCLLLGKSMASTYRYLADGTIPSPVKIGKATLWRVRDLRTFFDGLPADRGGV